MHTEGRHLPSLSASESTSETEQAIQLDCLLL